MSISSKRLQYHLVFMTEKGAVSASRIQVGDLLMSSPGSAKVTKVGSVQRQGLWAPATESGSIVVNGVVASNYISASKLVVALQEQGANSAMISEHVE